MATPPVKLKNFEDLLTCTICLETFKLPKYLPCLHTFCESCLNTYIVSFIEKDKNCDGFPCPVCRQRIAVEGNQDNKTSYASKLPTNHFVTSMLDMKAIETSEKLCNSCEFNNETTKAESWCTVCEEALCKLCEKFHKSFKMTSRHTIISLNDIQFAESHYQIISSNVYCDEHPERIVEVYCSDHSKPCCTLCATLSHRKCDDVISIEKAATGIKQSTQVSDLCKRLDCSSVVVEKVIESRKQNLQEIQNDRDAISQTITTLKQDMIEKLTKLEENFRFELESAEKQLSVKLTDDMDRFTSFRSIIRNWKSVINGCLEYGSDQYCLVELNKVLPNMSAIEDDIEDSSRLKHYKLNFALDNVFAEFKNNCKLMGNLSTDECKETVVNSVCSVNFEKDDIKIIHIIETVGHGGHDAVSGVFVDNFIILTLQGMMKVLKYSHDGTYLEKLELSNCKSIPDISAMNQSKVIVSSQIPNAIYVIDTVNMTVLQTVNLQNIPVYGLSFINDTDSIIISVGQTLTWIDISTGRSTGQNKTSGHSFFVTTLNDNYNSYISGDGQNAVSCFNGDKLKFKYESSQLSNPRGIGVDFKGNLYVTGYGSENIHQLTKEGKLIRIIPSTKFGIENPWTLRFAQNSSKFLITCCNSGKVAVCDFESK